MTSGSVPPADDQASTSTKEPTDGLKTGEKFAAGVFPITESDMADLLQRVYRTGWDLARALPERESPPEIDFDVKVSHEEKKVDLTVQVSI